MFAESVYLSFCVWVRARESAYTPFHVYRESDSGAT